jgi:hypothetical protein
MKKNIILIIVLVIISWLYFWINYINDNSREKNNNSNIDISFNDFSYDKIKSKDIEISDRKIIYTGTWEFVQDNEKINNFIDDLKSTKILSLVSTNKEKFDNFWVNNTWSVLKLWNSEIFLWNIKWWMWEQYIRVNWLDKVFLINKDLKSFLNKDYDFFKKEEIIEESASWSWETITWTWGENNN